MASRLSEVYTTLEIEYATSRHTLKDYQELFRDHGSRILVLGKPGIGKTTFTHKIGLDWARNEFEMFESVFVVKLRDLHPDQSICNAIALQYHQFQLTSQAIDEYLKHSNGSVLLILDGLDEIDLKKYRQVNRILCGIDYPSCCVMTTSRPHIALEIKDEMSCIAKITGFSKESAEQYISHFIPNPAARKELFKLLASRKMLEMYKVPIILQALALLFDDCKLSFPHTYTTTFNQLVELISLKKIRDGNTGLSEEDIEAAMQETNQLAFRCLIKDQLVFPTNLITNEHILKLGLLSVTKTATPHGKLSLAQFPHKTLQEYAAGGHVATEYIAGRTAAWGQVKRIFVELFKSTERSSYSCRGETNRSFHLPDTAEQQKNIINGMKKFIGAIMDNPRGRVAAIQTMARVFHDAGIYDDDPDKLKLRKVAQSLREAKYMTEEEFNASFEFMFDILSMADREQKKKLTERLNKTLHSSFVAGKFALELLLMGNWIDKSPDEAIEVMSSTFQSFFSSKAMVSSKVVAKHVQWLQDQVNSTKILFRFILGKLTRYPQLADKILKEIAELLLDHAFDSSSGEVLSIHFIQQYLLDLMPEAGFSHQFPSSALYSSEMDIPSDFFEAPLVVHLNSQLPRDVQLPDMTETKALSLAKIDSNFQPAIKHIENMKNLKLMELRDIKEKVLPGDQSQSLAKALSSTRLVSLVMDGIQDYTLCTALLENLPCSLLRLTVLDCVLRGTFQFPQVVNLQSLHIQGIASGVSGIFSSSFPHLKRIAITGLKWKQEDIRSLVTAVRGGRLPLLQHLCIIFGNLSKRGAEILEITQTCELQTLDLMDTNLTERDGQILLTQLEAGNLPSIRSLNLLHNSGLNSLVPRFLTVAADQHIDIQCAEKIERDTNSWSFKFHLVYGSVSYLCTPFLFYFLLPIFFFYLFSFLRDVILK